MPVIKFEMDAFEFDLAMACLPLTAIPDDFDITDDKNLRNVDPQSVTSLNGNVCLSVCLSFFLSVCLFQMNSAQR